MPALRAGPGSEARILPVLSATNIAVINVTPLYDNAASSASAAYATGYTKKRSILKR
jgi:hypothetical protein